MTEPLDQVDSRGHDADVVEMPGSLLRQEREARGLSIREVSSELHVDSRLLQSLESDDFDTLGAPIFVKGHLRNYARLLGLDPAPLLAGFERSASGAPPALRKRQGEGTPLESASGGAFMKTFGWVFIILVLIASAGWWYYQQESIVLESSELRVMSPATETETGSVQAEPVDGDKVDETATAVDPRAQLMTPIEMEEQQAAEDAAVSSNPLTASQTAGNPPAPSTDAREPVSTPTRQAVTPPLRQRTAVAGPSKISVSFSDASWIEMYDEKEQALLYDLVPAGSTRAVEASGAVRVFLGNAPAVSISVNGERFDVARYTRRDKTARFSIDPSN